MAHFAEIDGKNIVKRVIVVGDADCNGGAFPGSEAAGAAFCRNLLGGTWKQTSYNNNFRKRYAGQGYKYDADLDMFITPQPFASWTLSTEGDTKGDWVAPLEKPEGDYTWDEAAYQADNTQGWVAVEAPE
jgi:hypothetical protein